MVVRAIPNSARGTHLCCEYGPVKCFQRAPMSPLQHTQVITQQLRSRPRDRLLLSHRNSRATYHAHLPRIFDVTWLVMLQSCSQGCRDCGFIYTAVHLFSELRGRIKIPRKIHEECLVLAADPNMWEANLEVARSESVWP